jgi:dUTP pyrophosphatase
MFAIGFRKLVKHAQLPKRSRPGDIGYDLFSCENKVIPARKRDSVNTGIQLALPDGHHTAFTSSASAMTFSSTASLLSASGLTASSASSSVTSNYAKSKYYGRIAPRSGMSMRGIDVCAGVVDPNYEGAMGVVLHNHNDVDFKIKAGDRIAQLILEQCAPSDIPVYEIADDNSVSLCTDTVIDNTTTNAVRGAQGFGSSGK